ncbi:MAG: hypothetical protein JWO52_5209, partial [Gammaproteobacteria bacterium]|nr:hypothetical protein [Gammaproteobacteria bacterium]
MTDNNIGQIARLVSLATAATVA